MATKREYGLHQWPAWCTTEKTRGYVLEVLRSKFELNKKCTSQVDGINEPNIIAEHFALPFEKVWSNDTGEGAARLKSVC